jgi:hypothetical protein
MLGKAFHVTGSGSNPGFCGLNGRQLRLESDGAAAVASAMGVSGPI